jgi:hypothetical protein
MTAAPRVYPFTPPQRIPRVPDTGLIEVNHDPG